MSNKHTFDTFDSGYHVGKQSGTRKSSYGNGNGSPSDAQSYHSYRSGTSSSSCSSNSSRYNQRRQEDDTCGGRRELTYGRRRDRRTLTIRLPTILEVAEAVLPDRTADVLKISCLCNIITCACVIYLCTIAATVSMRS
jgi:hypothetical protein